MTEFYSEGTIAVENGSVDFVVTGGALLPTNAKKGDMLNVAGHALMLDEPTDSTHGKFAIPYPGATASGLPYAIAKTSSEWGTNRTLAMQTAEMIQLLTTVSVDSTGIAINAWGTFANRAAHDTAGAGFIYLSLDGDGVTGVWTLYSKLSAASGDWSDGQQIAGAKGDQGDTGNDGEDGADGADGNDGWTPVLAIVNDGARRVQQVIDWVGGEGTKPATGGYVGATGLTATIGDAIDIRGPAGAAGAGTGDMQAATYDPQGKAADAFARANHTGSQAISTITGLQTTLDAKAAASSLGTAASKDTGTGAGNVPVLDGGGKLPTAILPPLDGGDVTEVASRTALKALDTSNVTLAYLTESGRSGMFVWRTGNYSTQIAADTAEGIYLKADAIAATTGAWVRQFDRAVLASWFGTALQVAMNVAAILKQPLYLGEKGASYTTSGLNLPDDLTVFSQMFGGAGAKIVANSGNFTAITLGQRVKLIGIEVEGPGNDVFNASSYGVFQTGTADGITAPTYVEGPTIENCYIHGFRNAGVELRYVDGFTIRNSKINNSGYAGLAGISVKNGTVDRVEIDDVSATGTDNAYGMFFSRLNGSDTTYPASEYIKITRNVVRNVPKWHGFDTHGGRHIVWEDCDAYNCGRAFVLTFSLDATNQGRYAPRYSGFRRCRALQPPTAESARGEGFWIVGAYNNANEVQDYALNCFVEDCVFDGYGYERTSGQPIFPGSSLTVSGNTTLSCGVVQWARNAKVRGNIFRNTLGDCVRLLDTCLNTDVSGNHAYDWKSALVDPAFVRISGKSTTGASRGNHAYAFVGGTKVASIGTRYESGLTGVLWSNVDNRYDTTTAVSTGAGTTVAAYLNS